MTTATIPPECLDKAQGPQQVAENDCWSCRWFERCDPRRYRDDKA